MNMHSKGGASHLPTTRTHIAHSPIRVAPARRPRPVFADWESERKSAEVDALILAWIATHVQVAAQRSRLH